MKRNNITTTQGVLVSLIKNIRKLKDFNLPVIFNCNDREEKRQQALVMPILYHREEMDFEPSKLTLLQRQKLSKKRYNSITLFSINMITGSVGKFTFPIVVRNISEVEIILSALIILKLHLPPA